jgi:hypothetical protein
MGIEIVEVNVGTVEEPDLVNIEVFFCDCQCHKGKNETRRINGSKEPLLLRQIGEELVHPSGYRDCVHIPNHGPVERGKRRIFCVDCITDEDPQHIPHLQQDEKCLIVDSVNRRWEMERYEQRNPALRQKLIEQDGKLRPRDENILPPLPRK